LASAEDVFVVSLILSSWRVLVTVLFTNDGITISSPRMAVSVVSGTAVTAKAEAG
jgi:hypothetical protein